MHRRLVSRRKLNQAAQAAIGLFAERLYDAGLIDGGAVRTEKAWAWKAGALAVSRYFRWWLLPYKLCSCERIEQFALFVIGGRLDLLRSAGYFAPERVALRRRQ